MKTDREKLEDAAVGLRMSAKLITTLTWALEAAKPLLPEGIRSLVDECAQHAADIPEMTEPKMQSWGIE